MPLKAVKRGQVNFELEPIEGMPIMENMPQITYPWVWIEEGVTLPMYFFILFHVLVL